MGHSMRSEGHAHQLLVGNSISHVATEALLNVSLGPETLRAKWLRKRQASGTNLRECLTWKAARDGWRAIGWIEK